jgi:hypothetical protein
MAGATCPHCGAPWDPDLTGACRHCRVPAAGGLDAAGGGLGGAGGGLDAGLDPIAIARALGSRLEAAPTNDPLGPLAADLSRCVGASVTVRRHRGEVEAMELMAGEWRLTLSAEPAGRGGRRPAGSAAVVGEARHVVRGITLKREQVTVDEWVGRAAAALADWSARDGAVRRALLALET